MTDPNDRKRSWWGWGWQDMALTDDECRAFGAMIPGLSEQPVSVPTLDEFDLEDPRLPTPAVLESFVSAAKPDRLSHTMGKAYRDVIRALHRELPDPPDLVAYPRSEDEVVAVLDWASSVDAVVIPFGGGSSVVGGVEYRGDTRGGVISLDLTKLDRVLEVDRVSRAARIQGGVLGPSLEDQLRPHGYTLRHFPQSFEFSTLGGWLATRAGGHYATLHTHIDDFVESIRAVTPAGISESFRLPGSGAGPSPDRLMLGSEGTLGVITEAWMRVQDRPGFRRSVSVSFDNGSDAMAAVRAVAQSGLNPSNCRLLDPGEAGLSGASSTGQWVLILGVESAQFPVEPIIRQLAELVSSHGGAVPQGSLSGPGDSTATEATSDRDQAAESWRSSFIRMPYMRDGLARMGAIVETFETSMTWDRVEDLYEDVNAELGRAIVAVTGAPGLINCRFTHVYPDGAAPYFTVIAAGRPGAELAQWDELKAASMEILTRHRATVTHHHAVGRDHRPGYDRQRPDVFAAAFKAAKSALDPAGILNPGVLID